MGGVVWVATDLLFAATVWPPIDITPLQTFGGGDVIPLHLFFVLDLLCELGDRRDDVQHDSIAENEK